MPYANPLGSGQCGDLSPRHRVGYWYPVMLVELVPSVAAGDTRSHGHGPFLVNHDHKRFGRTVAVDPEVTLQ